MFTTPAFAQAAGSGSSDFFIQFMPFILILVILYFLIIRPQQRRVKEHKALVDGLRRGDTVVTTGGLVGKIVKVFDDKPEVNIEFAPDVRITVLKQYVSDVRAKGEPAKIKAKPRAKPKTKKSA